MKTVELYTRVGCHLCEVVHEQLERVRTESPFELAVIDVDTDASLVDKYGQEVPVVLLDGKKIAKYHLDEDMLRRRLDV